MGEIVGRECVLCCRVVCEGRRQKTKLHTSLNEGTGKKFPTTKLPHTAPLYTWRSPVIECAFNIGIIFPHFLHCTSCERGRGPTSTEDLRDNRPTTNPERQVSSLLGICLFLICLNNGETSLTTKKLGKLLGQGYFS
jgi:hypothetical protein